jgi:integrase
LGKRDRPTIDPFSIQEAEVFITALHQDWGEAYGNYDEFRFFTGLRPSEEIALTVTDYDANHRILSVTKARVNGVDQDTTKTGKDRRIALCPSRRHCRTPVTPARSCSGQWPRPTQCAFLHGRR